MESICDGAAHALNIGVIELTATAPAATDSNSRLLKLASDDSPTRLLRFIHTYVVGKQPIDSAQLPIEQQDR